MKNKSNKSVVQRITLVKSLHNVRNEPNVSENNEELPISFAEMFPFLFKVSFNSIHCEAGLTAAAEHGITL